jgi:hypothetical protein
MGYRTNHLVAVLDIHLQREEESYFDGRHRDILV